MADIDTVVQSAPPRALEWIGPILLALATGLGALKSAPSRPKELLTAPTSLTTSRMSSLNLGLVRDTTLDNSVPPELGHRYRVQLAEPARWEVGAIARVGGRVVVVPDASPGVVCVVEVTGRRGSAFEAKVVGSFSARTNPPTGPAPAATSGILVTGVVEGIGSRGDGKLRVGGRTIYVSGVATGDCVMVEIVRDHGTYSVGRLVQRIPHDVLTSSAPQNVTPASASVTVITGIVEGVGSRGDGRIQWQGRPLYIPDTKPGETVVVEVVRQTDRFAIGRCLQRLGGSNDPIASVSSATNAAATDTATPTKLQPGTVLEVEVTEPARRAPDRDGVARVHGFPIIVPNTRPGQKVRIRITEVREHVAYAVVEPGPPLP